MLADYDKRMRARAEAVEAQLTEKDAQIAALMQALRRWFVIWDDGRDYASDPMVSDDVVMAECAATEAILADSGLAAGKALLDAERKSGKPWARRRLR